MYQSTAPPSAHNASEWGEVLALLARRLPGVRLESVVQGWAYMDQFESGIEAHGRIPEPSPDDDRWLGVCYFKTFDDNLALQSFVRAGRRGAVGALVNQAHLLRFLERSDESRTILDGIEPSRLSQYDQVLYFRVKSIDEETSGNIRLALMHAEDAWRRVQGIPEFPVLAPSVLAQLGVLYARYGRAQRALWYLERGIQITSGSEQLKVRLKRSIVLTSLGRFADARSELNSLTFGGDASTLDVERRCLLGDVAWALGDLVTAIDLYASVATSPGANDYAYETFLSELAIMTISGALGRFEDAQRYRKSASHRLSDKSDELQFQFRELVLDHWTGTLDTNHVLAYLGRVASELNAMGLLQEFGAVKAHMAAISMRSSQSVAEELLSELLSLSVALQNNAFLAREWAILPELERLARRTHPSLVGRGVGILELHTLGQERIVMAGADVHLPLRRAPELLAYFMDRRTATFEDIWRDLFPGTKRRTAKSYFHQFRHQLQSRVSGLRIEFDRGSGAYRLASEVDILWDVADVRARRREGAVGPFLPSATSDWALTLDFEMEQFRSTG